MVFGRESRLEDTHRPGFSFAAGCALICTLDNFAHTISAIIEIEKWTNAEGEYDPSPDSQAATIAATGSNPRFSSNSRPRQTATAATNVTTAAKLT